MFPSNFIVSGVKNSRQYPVLILNVALFFILFIYIFVGALSVSISEFLVMYSKQSCTSDTEYDPSVNLRVLFHSGADILNSLLLYNFFYHFPSIVNAKI